MDPLFFLFFCQNTGKPIHEIISDWLVQFNVTSNDIGFNQSNIISNVSTTATPVDLAHGYLEDGPCFDFLNFFYFSLLPAFCIFFSQ